MFNQFGDLGTLMRRGFIVAVLVFLLAACGAGPHAVQDGKLRDVIFAIETKQNGSHFIWMRYDDVGTYCTMNDALFSEIEAIFNDKTRTPEIILQYTSLNVGEQENPSFLADPIGIQGCKHNKATVYIIESIEVVNQ